MHGAVLYGALHPCKSEFVTSKGAGEEEETADPPAAAGVSGWDLRKPSEEADGRRRSTHPPSTVRAVGPYPTRAQSDIEEPDARASSRPTPIPSPDPSPEGRTGGGSVSVATPLRHKDRLRLPFPSTVPARTAAVVPEQLAIRLGFVLLHVDGASSVAEIAERVQLDVPDVVACTFELAALGLVELTDPPSESRRSV